MKHETVFFTSPLVCSFFSYNMGGDVFDFGIKRMVLIQAKILLPVARRRNKNADAGKRSEFAREERSIKRKDS